MRRDRTTDCGKCGERFRIGDIVIATASRVIGDDPGIIYDFPAFSIHDECPATIITEAKQLAALPFLTIIREIFRPSPGSGADYGGVYERRTSGWQSIAGAYTDPQRNGEPRLPARVIYTPETR